MSHVARTMEAKANADFTMEEDQLRLIERGIPLGLELSPPVPPREGPAGGGREADLTKSRDGEHMSVSGLASTLSADDEAVQNAALSDSDARVAKALRARRVAGLIGEIPAYWLLDSPGLAGVLDLARRLARAPGVPVLIQGERGAGTQELARLIHEADPVARHERLCTMTASLIGSAEIRGRPLGTLVIEDVENLRPAAQTWLASLLADRTATPQPLRIVAVSRKSAGELQHHEGLSPELVHDLDVGRLIIPPLRDRPSDILKLARRFLGHHARWRSRPALRFSEAAERKLVTHTYPANVRELRNLVERAVALSTSDEVGVEAIVVFDSSEPTLGGYSAGPRGRSRSADQAGARLPTLAEMERDYLVTLIKELRGRRMAISRTMGVSYPTVLRKIALYGLDVRAIVGTNRLPDTAG